jgi:hypothetical protein
MMRFRSRPEANQASYFLDTGEFPASHSLTSQFEVMAIKGPGQLFGELSFTPVSSPPAGNPFFYGSQLLPYRRASEIQSARWLLRFVCSKIPILHRQWRGGCVGGIGPHFLHRPHGQGRRRWRDGQLQLAGTLRGTDDWNSTTVAAPWIPTIRATFISFRAASSGQCRYRIAPPAR